MGLMGKVMLTRQQNDEDSAMLFGGSIPLGSEVFPFQFVSGWQVRCLLVLQPKSKRQVEKGNGS